jgi:hypothetical protein
MAFGRPTAYQEDYCQQIISHFDQPLYVDKIKEVASGGRAVKITEEKPNSMPTFESFAGKIGVTHNTLRNWCKEYPDFLSAYSYCKDIQKKFIIEHGMMGNYNPGFAKFVAINVTDLQDKVVHEVKSAGITLNVTPDESGL